MPTLPTLPTLPTARPPSPVTMAMLRVVTLLGVVCVAAGFRPLHTGRRARSIAVASATTAASAAVAPVPTTTPSPLIELAETFITSQSGFYSPHNSDMFSDEFVFRGPVVGPLNKADYLNTMDTVS